MSTKDQKPAIVVTSLSRRSFLKGSAAAISAALAASAGGRFFSKGLFGPNVARAASKEVVFAIQEFAHPAIKSVLPDFEKASGFTVTLEGGPVSGNDMLTKYSAAFAAGNSPVDVMSDADDSSPTFMRAGWVMPLNDIIPEATWKDFPDSMKPHIDGFLSINGVRYRIPHEFAVGYFFTRKDWLDSKNLKSPATWDEMVEIGKQFTDSGKGVFGTTDALIKPALMYVFVAYLTAQAGGKVFDFDDQTGEALQFLYDMIYKHKIFPDTALNQDYTAQNELYMADKIAFMREWPFFADVGKGKKDWYKPEKMVIELPPAGKAGSKSWIGGWGYSIPTAAPNPEGAKALLTYLTSVEVAPKLAAQQGFLLTPRNSILKALEGSDNALLPAIAAYSKANVFAARPFNPRVAEAQTIVDDVASSFLTKQSSLSDALKQGQDRMKALSTK